MKKKVLILAVLAAFSSIIATGTLAYYTAEDKAHNVITSGSVGSKIIETTMDSEGKLVEFPAGGIDGVMPGTSVSKIVVVQNDGKADAWIRVKVEAAINSTDSNSLPLSLSTPSNPVMAYDIEADWIEGEDGYYYYKDPVKPGEETKQLFDTVSFAAEMDNRYQGCTAQLMIYAESVQVANNGTTVLKAKGWPKQPNN